MLGDLFDEPQNNKDSAGAGQHGSGSNGSNKTKKRYIADDMDLPPIKKAPGEFSGLMNPGATCYLNSLFQSLYFNPEMRNLLLSVDLDSLSAYEKDSGKYRLIREFQFFFLRLQHLSFKNHTTRALTDCFGWNTQDEAEQQDFAEASRSVVDALERALFEAGLSEVFNAKFK